MFVVFRSLFWLSLAYMVIKPGVDIDATARAVSAQALASGTQIVAEGVQSIACDTLACVGGKSIVAAALPPPVSADDPMHLRSASNAVPLPRPRPGRAG